MSKKPIINRMRRVRGQLEKLECAIEAGQPCAEVIPQFLAVKGAANAAFAAYVKATLAECSASDTHEQDALIAALARM